MRIFVDTNILIDMLDDRRENHNAAMLLLLQDKIEIFAAADSILTMRYIFRKTENSEIAESLLSFFDIVKIVDTKSKAVKEALELSLATNEKDIEDLTKIITARDLACELFVTSDIHIDNIINEIPITSISETLNALSYKKDLFGNWKNEEDERKKRLREELEKLGKKSSVEEINEVLRELRELGFFGKIGRVNSNIQKKDETNLDLFLSQKKDEN